jgi:hypothetical protein
MYISAFTYCSGEVFRTFIFRVFTADKRALEFSLTVLFFLALSSSLPFVFLSFPRSIDFELLLSVLIGIVAKESILFPNSTSAVEGRNVPSGLSPPSSHTIILSP